MCRCMHTHTINLLTYLLLISLTQFLSSSSVALPSPSLSILSTMMLSRVYIMYKGEYHTCAYGFSTTRCYDIGYI